METADKSDEQPGPSKSAPPPASAGESREASPPPPPPPPSGSGQSQSGKLDLYATLGLTPEDVEALAQLPEEEISIETLPRLIMQLKAKRAKSGGRPAVAEASASSAAASPSAAASLPAKEEKEEHVRDECDQEDCDADYADSAPSLQSASKTPVPRYAEDDESYVTMDDLIGTTPRSFQHKCSLCSCLLNSAAQWNDHAKGSRHGRNRREFLQRNPDFLPHDSSSEAPDSRSGGGDGHPVLKDPSDVFQIAHAREPSYHARQRYSLPGTKVVTCTFFRGTATMEDLLGLAKPFGTVVDHIMFPKKGMLEFSTHENAVAMVSHFGRKPARLKQTMLKFCLSPEVCSIQVGGKVVQRLRKKASLLSLSKASLRGLSKTLALEKPLNPNNGVVCFSKLPPNKETESEILEVAKMFGEVQYSKVVDHVVLVKMEDSHDAAAMEKYYHYNQLKLFGKFVKVRITSAFHKQLREMPDPSRRGDSSGSSSSVAPKSKGATKSFNLKNKDKASSQKDWTGKKTGGGDARRPADEHERMDVSLDNGGEEDGEGMKFGDEFYAAPGSLGFA